MGKSGLAMILQGLCQGNGADPACWTMIVAVLMHCYEGEGFRAQIMSCISKVLTEFMGTIFINDTDMNIMGPYWRDLRAVYQEMPESTYMWVNLL